ncbi:Lysosomal alpha-mannosidase II [Carabus blaptoides fortunei]
MNLLLYLFLLIVSGSAFPKYYNKQSTQQSCGYSNCPSADPNVLNVHIVPHTHDDVGWLKTVDQYYYGARNYIQKAGVQYILDSVIEALLENPKRRFIYVETAFLWKWWQENSAENRDKLKYLVNNGQLEIVGGGWSMNDEAASHYQSIIDQFTWGFRKLEDTLGKCACPKIGWQIDPFGHSRETASLFSQFGFDGLFFARLDYRDRLSRLHNKTAEMLWQGSQSLGPSSQLFTSILYNHYSAPPGFCFDVLCSDDSIVENQNSPEYNAERKARAFLSFVKQQASYYKTNNIIITMGDDFHYQDALYYFKNLDKLISAVNKLQTKTKVFYSSPSCYIKALNEANQRWSVKTDDFFPYASDAHAYWTGYYTSRPTSKRFERIGNNFLQVSKQLAALTGLEDSVAGLDPLREAMGVMQHHDAITGTEKQHVADDYARIISEALDSASVGTTAALRKLQEIPEVNMHSCLLMNISQCYWTDDDFGNLMSITVYNPLSRPVSHYVRIPLQNPQENYFIDAEYQIVPIFERILNIPGRTSKARAELVFKAESIPALGFKTYSLKSSRSRPSFSNKDVELQFYNSGHLKSALLGGQEVPLSQNFLYYRSANGNNVIASNRSSGAYVFRPQKQYASNVTRNVKTVKYIGPLVEEYHQTFNDWIGQVIRKYKDEDYVEFQWIVGPIPVEDEIGKEIITRFTSDIKSKGVFFTDSNGREMIKRVRGHRDTFNLTHEEPVSENYYPVTSKILIKDESTGMKMAVLNDRAQGGSSLHDGQIELMVHRRLLNDDWFGVAEALNEKAFGVGLVATGKHYVIAGNSQNTGGKSIVAKEKELAQKISLEPWVFFNSRVDNLFDYRVKNSVRINFSGVSQSLPSNVQILTLEPWSNNVLLLRLEHFYEKDEDPLLSSSVTVNIKQLFTDFDIIQVEEMSLGGNQFISEVDKLKWKAECDELDENTVAVNNVTNNAFEIQLSPMQIKTFLITIDRYI